MTTTMTKKNAFNEKETGTNSKIETNALSKPLQLSVECVVCHVLEGCHAHHNTSFFGTPEKKLKLTEASQRFSNTLANTQVEFVANCEMVLSIFSAIVNKN